MLNNRETLADYFYPEYMPQFYRSSHVDLSSFNDAQLENHYRTYGFYEGRVASPHQLRENVKEIVTKIGSCLEIGPSSVPTLTGKNVFYFDVLDTERLIEKARSCHLPLERMPEKIHYWHEHGDLSVIDQQFDLVFSSHCIEHQPNLIKHLNQVERLLHDNGVYLLVVPDKRFCFDHFFPSTSIDDVLQVHRSGRSKAVLKTLDNAFFAAHNDPGRHWRGDHGEQNLKKMDVNIVRHIIMSTLDAHENGAYLDTHHWHFWPEQFKYLMNQLYRCGVTQLRPLRVYPTPTDRFEFVAVLSKQLGPILDDHAIPDEQAEWKKLMERAASRIATERAWSHQ